MNALCERTSEHLWAIIASENVNSDFNYSLMNLNALVRLSFPSLCVYTKYILYVHYKSTLVVLGASVPVSKAHKCVRTVYQLVYFVNGVYAHAKQTHADTTLGARAQCSTQGVSRQTDRHRARLAATLYRTCRRSMLVAKRTEYADTYACARKTGTYTLALARERAS